MLRRFVIPFLVLCVAMLFAARVAGWWTQAWWFEDVSRTSGADYRALYLQVFAWRAALFVCGALAFGGFLSWQWSIAARVIRHSAAPLDIGSTTPARRRLVPLEDKLQLDRFQPFVIGGTIALLAFLAGSYASLNWLPFFRLQHAGIVGEIGPRDPVWHLDARFYLFRLPALSLLWSFGLMAIVLAIALISALYAYEEVWELGGRRVRLAPPGLWHFSALLAALMGWNALGHQLRRYTALSEARQTLAGIGAVDWFVSLPVAYVLSLASLLVAFGCWRWGRVTNTNRRHEKTGQRIATLLSTYVLASWLLGTLIPAAMQRWWVLPQEAALEAPFLIHHWKWTRAAYALGEARSRSPVGASALPSKVLWTAINEGQRQTLQAGLDDLPLWPPDAVRQWLARVAPEQRFSTLHFDRYLIAGQWRPVYVASRWNGVATPVTWRQHHAPPHDEGLFICDARRAAPDGHPLMYRGAAWLGLSDTPHALRAEGGNIVFDSRREDDWIGWSRSDLRPPRSTSGRSETPVSFFDRPTAALLAPARAPLNVPAVDYLIRELPARARDASDTPAKYFAGIELGAFWRRCLLALRFGDLNLMLATQLPSRTRLAWHTDVSERCRQIAPFWTWGEPTPVLDEANRVVWLLDGFSIASTYPYAQPLEGTPVNFLRAGVVATVDADSGATRFYMADPDDPFLNLYQRACPTLLRPISQMPAALRRHLRYPAALLSAQAEIWARFHVGNPSDLLRPDTRWQLLPEAPAHNLALLPRLPVRFNFSDLPGADATGDISKYFERAFCTVALFTQQPVTKRTMSPSAKQNPDADDREIVGALFATRDEAATQLASWQPSRALALESMAWINDSDFENGNMPIPSNPFVAREWSAPLFFTLRHEVAIGTQTRWPLDQPIGMLDDGAVMFSSSQLSLMKPLPDLMPTSTREGVAQNEANPVRQKIALFQHNRLTTLRLAATPPTIHKAPVRRRPSPPSKVMAPHKKRAATLPPTSNPARVLRQTRRLWRTMKEARQRGDWKTYGQAERALDKVLQR